MTSPAFTRSGLRGQGRLPGHWLRLVAFTVETSGLAFIPLMVLMAVVFEILRQPRSFWIAFTLSLPLGFIGQSAPSLLDGQGGRRMRVPAQGEGRIAPPVGRHKAKP
jgi:hypothetical protein